MKIEVERLPDGPKALCDSCGRARYLTVRIRPPLRWPVNRGVVVFQYRKASLSMCALCSDAFVSDLADATE